MTDHSSESYVRTLLKEVMDPELGVNIVDLGLVHSIAIEGTVLHITMTFTTPTCPLGTFIQHEVESLLIANTQFARVHVEVVQEPVWTPERMSTAARNQLFGGNA